MNNPETLVTPGTQNRGQINVRENQVLPVSLDCSFLITPLVFSNVYLSCVLCTRCYQCLWIVHS
jgi:hypothetical protein